MEQFGTNAMTLPSRQVLAGIVLGAMSAYGVAAIGPGPVVAVFADEAPAGFDTNGLIKHDEREYRVAYDPSVSTEPLSSVSIKKIEAGRVSYVTIATTETGTYSSDAMTSPHVSYPGIEVESVEEKSFFFHTWSNGQWLSLGTVDGHSFVNIGRWH
jgi:hypothetical protein